MKDPAFWSKTLPKLASTFPGDPGGWEEFPLRTVLMYLSQYPAVVATQNLRLTTILATALGTAKDKDFPARNMAEWEEIASRGKLETVRVDSQAPAPSLEDFASLLALQGKTDDSFEVTELEGPMNLPE